MSNNVINLKDLSIGMTVEISPQSDRTRKLRVKGNISEILTNKDNHPHGILVLLESGDKGRVKAIVGQENSSQKEVVVNSIAASPSMNLKELILEGENHNIEFKSGALWSSKLTGEDIKNYRPQSKELHTYGQNTSKVIISKTMASFLNTDGGTLIIGVQENKNNNKDEIIGIESEFEFLKDPCEDGYRRMLVDVIKDYFPKEIFNHLNQYLQINFENINDNLVCGITASKSDQKVFIHLKGVDHFYIRTDASSRELLGVEIVDYCEKHF